MGSRRNGSHDGVRNRVEAQHISGPVVQAGSIGSVHIAGAPADELGSAVGVVADATKRLWDKAQVTWRIFPEAPVEVAWDQDRDRSLVQEPRLSAGTITRLYDEVYDVPGRRQVVLVGDAGTGKSTAMLLLLNEALKRRSGSSTPVPVWLTLGRWDPRRTTLTEYATAVIAALPVRWRDRLTRATAQRLVEEGRVALFLDGLDEMPHARRAKAIESINRLTDRRVRVVVTTRPTEAGSNYVRKFARPVVIRLKPVDVDTASEFLLDGHTGGDLRHWQELVDFLRANPRSAAAQALTTPLTISLARDAFPHADDAEAKPIELAGFAKPQDVVQRLIGLFLDRAYSVDGERDRHRLRERRSRRHARERATLTWVAHHLGDDRDLAWWHIPTWLSVQTLRFRCGMRAGLAVLSVMLIGAVVPGTGGNWADLLTPAGAAFLLADRLGVRRIGAPPTTLAWRWPKRADLGRSILFWLTGGLVVGGITAVFLDLASGAAVAVLVSVMGVLGGGMATRPDDKVAGGLLASSTVLVHDSPSLTPYDAFRADVRRTLLSAVICAVVGAGLGVAFGLLIDLPVLALLWCTSLGLLSGLVAGTGPGWLLARARPELTGAATVMASLESALDRQVLRQAGTVYQFRHAVIQDHLTRLG